MLCIKTFLHWEVEIGWARRSIVGHSHSYLDLDRHTCRVYTLLKGFLSHRLLRGPPGVLWNFCYISSISLLSSFTWHLYGSKERETTLAWWSWVVHAIGHSHSYNTIQYSCIFILYLRMYEHSRRRINEQEMFFYHWVNGIGRKLRWCKLKVHFAWPLLVSQTIHAVHTC